MPVVRPAATAVITLPPGSEGKRADTALSEVLPQSRSRVAALIKSGDILMNGGAFKPSAVIEGGESFLVHTPPPRGGFAGPEDGEVSLDIIFEDGDIIVINKPAGLTVHPGAGRAGPTLAGALARRYRENLSTLGGTERPGIVHRLDKDTSGVLVAAKNDVCHAALSRQFAEREVSKEYEAIVCGEMKKNSGVFSSGIGRSPRDRKKMSGKNPARPRRSVTEWEVVERIGGWTFVRIRPQTGRTHQIRVHFSEAGHPVAADPLYGTKEAKALFASSGLAQLLRRQALHAAGIGFSHPATGKRMSFSAPLAADIADALNFLRARGGKNG